MIDLLVWIAWTTIYSLALLAFGFLCMWFFLWSWSRR